MMDFHLNEEEETKDSKSEEKEKPFSVDQKLFKSRTITIYSGIDQKLAKDICQKLLALAAESDEPITLFLHSQGGHVESGDSIFDMIRFIKPDVKIIGTGWVASAGALIFTAAKKEKPFLFAKYTLFVTSTQRWCSRSSNRYWHRSTRNCKNAQAFE